MTTGIAQVRRFIELHGESRFTPWGADGEDGNRPTINRAGFRKPNDEGGVEYYVLPQVWRTEVCAGLDAGAVARTLADRGMLRKRSDKKPQYAVRLPGFTNPVSCIYDNLQALAEGKQVVTAHEADVTPMTSASPTPPRISVPKARGAFPKTAALPGRASCTGGRYPS